MVVRLVVRMEVRMVVRLVVRMEPPAREGVGGLAQPLTQPFTNHGLKMHFKTFQAFFANIANTPLSSCQGAGFNNEVDLGMDTKNETLFLP